ncbi:hypothetical protein CP10139811_1026 [Chlamydia ibidis]|uniref:Uncharacterized protein n=2 Tax=Chlamydia ibidis TaxID=1405396 RepID=S7KLV0_9CHLA|nr:hypothetical protein CP10139811_1026 [Chlamydia ibidis]EQM62906.1 hypothetical protein H359_0344 [Chlamydia ibidis 10-1398/6]
MSPGGGQDGDKGSAIKIKKLILFFLIKLNHLSRFDDVFVVFSYKFIMIIHL